MTIRRRTRKSTTAKPKLALVRLPGPVEEDARKAALQADIVRLKSEGLNHGEIGRALGITSIRVTELLTDALEEYYADRDEAVKKYLAIANARYDRIFRTWMPRMEGMVRKVKDEETGIETEVFDPPDPEAARVVLTAMRDAARMMGLNKIRVEHTGKDGGAISHEIDWVNLSDEQLARFTETRDPGLLRAIGGGFARASAPRDPSSSGEAG